MPPVQTHFHLPILQVLPVRQVQWQPWLNDSSGRNTQPSTNASPSLLWPLRQPAGSFWSETPLFLKELSHCLIQVTGEAKSFICLQQCLSVTVQREKVTAVMGTIGVPPPLLTSFLNCSASLVSLHASLLYFHNEVPFPILLLWTYFCCICRDHSTLQNIACKMSIMLYA